MSTVAPAESEELNAAVEGAGCKLIRGPVTGSTMLAQNGTLGILASGDKDTYDIVLPYFEILGKNPVLSWRCRAGCCIETCNQYNDRIYHAD